MKSWIVVTHAKADWIALAKEAHRQPSGRNRSRLRVDRPSHDRESPLATP
jgi:hypothetical protein